MREPTPQPIQLEDYTSPAFLIDSVDLDFDIHVTYTDVRARLTVRRNSAAVDAAASLRLDGEVLSLQSIAIDGRQLAADEYEVADRQLSIARVPPAFTLDTTVRIHPRDNTTLMGLFASKDGLFTQCEAEGFRRMTYMIDRPDVMARYTTTIRADQARYPVLLSNGNLVGAGIEDADATPDERGGINLLRASRSTRHWAKWQDPFVKPSYLFALVAATS